ncbi:hypothetical protein OG792_00925 [Micromonospora sp. NBC_01699]|uniref:hypothetical protein n=1 Tax=Micromonospora sp. NBC_01699 TaxID=2975984 RepID=UPI002E2840E2|nr:hypothetical protein [Micromonospora sp. NBC_01699]
MKVNIIGKAMAVGFAVAVAMAAIAVPASADPTTADDYRLLTGVGSDTTQDAVNALGNVILSGGAKVVASWDARGTSPIKTKAAGCSYVRPNGSGAGRQALRASEGENLGGTHGGPGFFNGVDIRGCVDFARSSSYGGSSPSPTGTYTYIPMGVDAVALAINSNNLDLPLNMSLSQVQRVYKCFSNNVGGNRVTPRMIQADSGTWQFWIGPTRMAITEAEINLGDYPCLAADTDSNPGTPAVPVFPREQEHDGTPLAGNLNHVIPFSAAQFIAQTNRASIQTLTGVAVADRRGPALLTGMSTTTQPATQPIVGGRLNTNFPMRRDVYNVVPTADLTNQLIADTFVGAGSAVCTATVNDGGTQRNVVQLLGFGQRTTTVNALEAACGYTDLRANS